MNKKGWENWETVIAIIVILVFAFGVLAMFVFPNALLPKITKVTKGFERFLPGKPETEIPPGLNAPKEITEIFNSLYNAFINSKGKKGCFIKYESLNMDKYSIELEYSEKEKGLYMRLLNEKKQLVSDHFVNGVKPCIALPDKNDNIAKVSPLNKADIKNDNELRYGGYHYHLFGDYPLLYKPTKEQYSSFNPAENDWACFFADDAVIDPIDGKTVYGTAGILGWEGFDEDDMRRFEKGIPKCI